MAKVEFKNLSFSYKNQPVFDKLSDSIDGNQFIAVVGANGSGKSTLMKLILGFLKPNSGDISILGHSPGDYSNRRKIGTSLQDIDFPTSERVKEVLEFVSQQYQDSANLEALMESFFLTEFCNKPCGQLSGGMKRRLSLACAFVGKPELVLLDEPTTGLDHASRSQLMLNLKKYQQESKALVFMISHYPDEVIQTVDEFFHVKDSAIRRITPTEMEKFTGYRKINFSSKVEFKDSSAFRVEKNNDQYEVIVSNSDQWIQEFCGNGTDFENLTIRKLEAQELIEEIL